MNEVIIVISLIALSCYLIAQLPSTFTWTRKVIMPHAPEKIFPHINNLKRWNEWSPWAKLDPDCKNTFEGPEEGSGAVLKWDGNKDVGAGVMTVTSSIPNRSVSYRLQFLKPMRAVSNAEITLMPEGEGTSVSWSMSGYNGFVAKLMGVFIDCEKKVGDQFEQGLANLDDVVKKAG